VSPPAVIERESHRRRISSAARVIPGAPAASVLARKKPHSATWDGRFWAAEEAEPLRPRAQRHALETLAEAVLPAPSTAGQRPRLAASVAADFLALLASFTAANHLWWLFHLAVARDGPASTRTSLFSICCLGPLLLQGAVLTLLGFSEGLYAQKTTLSPRGERFLLAKVVAWSTLLLAAAVSLGIDEMSLGALLGAAPLTFLIMLSWRQWPGATAYAEGKEGSKNVLIVGTGRLALEVAAYLEQHPGLGRVVRGFLAEDGPVGGDARGTVEDLARVARAEFVDEVLLAIPEHRDLARRVIREARRNRLDVKIVPDLLGFQSQPVALENLGQVPVLTLYEEPIPAFGLLLKRVVDVLGATAGLLLLTPLLALIALLIKLDSRGPVLYRAARVGRKGRKFLCCKFRTMVGDADSLKAQLRASNEREGPFFKMARDPRVTRVGRWLRRYSLDELPQLWNVLRGEMSLVGPRPHPLDDFERYTLEDLRRLDVTPGITGLWQVTARRDPSFVRNMALDLEYIEGWSLGMDLRILWRTVSVVLQGSGA
jgi:exopolysaccharide biosynthesis polyprenyl glycosylphosphotransferase